MIGELHNVRYQAIHQEQQLDGQDGPSLVHQLSAAAIQDQRSYQKLMVMLSPKVAMLDQLPLMHRAQLEAAMPRPINTASLPSPSCFVPMHHTDHWTIFTRKFYISAVQPTNQALPGPAANIQHIALYPLASLPTAFSYQAPVAAYSPPADPYITLNPVPCSCIRLS